jgi:alkanesulfonate monooxygenase SsuD/methylene tetrahydromethanopterin reductase-like flavin-dependent oxidoreductase (luciferase family)
MKFGLISIPMTLDYAAGKQTVRDVIDWDLTVLRWADQYGLAEAYFAEHYTLGHEPSPAPDLMIAAASQVTQNIRLGALAHLLPYHNPVALGFRLMWLDHMTGGRYNAGFAPGAYPSDAQLFDTGRNNPDMLAEGMDIIEAIWTRPGPYRIEGKYWTMDMPAYSESIHGPHLKPLQDPHPPILMTGMQASSPTLTLAGQRGYHPVSQQVNAEVLRTHWDTYAAAAVSAGHTPSRNNWRIARDVFVADSDEQARELALDGALGRLWTEYLLPTFIKLGLGGLIGGDRIAEPDLTVEWMVDNYFFVGSPSTVADKAAALFDETGGFGTLFSTIHNYSDDPEPYRRNLELVGTVVAPRLAELTPSE